MTKGDESWSMTFAVPASAPGVRLYSSDFLHGTDDLFTNLISAKHRMVETLTVFDNVFWPEPWMYTPESLPWLASPRKPEN